MKSDRASSFLRKYLGRAQKAKAKLSLRALARLLKVSSSHLSKVFRGERPLTPELIEGIARHLQLDHHEKKEIYRLAEIEPRAARKRSVPSTASHVVTEFAALGATEYWALEKWYYLPIIALCSTEKVYRSGEEISKRLRLPVLAADQALARLVKEGYLVRGEDGGYLASQLRLRFPTQRSHASVRLHHRQMIERALKELSMMTPSEAEFSQRLISGLTFAGNPDHLEAAKVLIEEALYRAAETLAEGPCTEVFQLNLQLFKHSR